MKKRILIFILFVAGIFTVSALSNEEKRKEFIAAGKAYMGTPYVYGGVTKSGIDCSGFILCAYRDAGLGTLPHNAAQIYYQCAKIDDSEREAGDLVFFYDGKISHVAIFLGGNKILHAASDGPRTGVTISKLTEPYWKSHYYAAGRLIGSAKTSVASSGKSSSSGKKSSSSSSSSSKKKKKKKKTSFSADLTLFGDYDFLTTDKDHFNFHMNGGTVQADLLFSKYMFKPGIMGRFTYLYPQNGEPLTIDSFIKDFRVPVCLELFITDYFGIYSGVVFGPQITGTEPVLYCYDKTEKQLSTPLYPGIFGLTVKTPDISIGKYKYSLVQDVSFTNYQAAEGEEKLTAYEKLAAGLTFSTGIKIRMPF